MNTLLAIVRQVAVLIVFSYIGNWITAALGLPITGSIVGLVLLFVLLKLGVIRVSWLETGANWLLSNMLLFFVPAAVGVLGHKELLSLSGIGLVAVIVVGTLIVMGCSGLLAETISRRKETAK